MGQGSAGPFAAQCPYVGYPGKEKLYEDFGEMLFTHFGVSGPLVLSASGCIPAKAFDQELSMTIDLKPALDVEQLDHRILREFDEMKISSLKILWGICSRQK